MIQIQLLTEEQVRAFTRWQYEGPYALYNMTPDDEATFFLDPDNGYFGLMSAGELWGFCNFGADARVPGGDYGATAVDVGIGMRPDLTGQGKGAAYSRAVFDFARRRFPGKPLRVTIAAFNERAQQVCRRHGFRQTQRFTRERDGRDFIVMVADKSKETTMITHMVLFKLKDRSAANIEIAVARIRRLEGQIPSLRDLEVGVDVIKSDRSYDVGLIARFDDLAGLEAYQKHPAHLPVLDYIRSVAETAAAVDFES